MHERFRKKWLQALYTAVAVGWVTSRFALPDQLVVLLVLIVIVFFLNLVLWNWFRWRDKRTDKKPTKIRPIAFGGGNFGRFFYNFVKCRPQVAVDPVWDGEHERPCEIWCFCVKQWPNYSTLCWPDTFYALLCSIHLQFTADWKQLATDVISGRFVGLTVSDKSVKFSGPHLNRFGEIRPKVVGWAFSTVSRTLINPNRK